MEQGRRAMAHALLGTAPTNHQHLQPYGIFTIPEISMVGETEESLTTRCVPYEVVRRTTARSRAARSSATSRVC